MASDPASFGWRLRNSWWVLLAVLGLGCLSGAGFLYVGITARRPAWWGTGVAYFVLAWSGLVAINRLPRESPLSSAIAVAYFVLWFASIVHALILNGSWLRWRAAHRPWFEQQAPVVLSPPPVLTPPAPPPVFAPPAPPVFTPPPVFAPPAPPVFTPPPVFASPAPPVFTPPPVFTSPAPPVFTPPPVFASPATPVEVNSATAAQLIGLGVFDLARAERVVADREARGGFASVDDFATAAALAPHEFVRVRPRLVCVPRPPAPRPPGGGRVVDF